MARLELHGPGGTVESVDLPRSGSLLIGSDAVCDIQVLDTDVQPIHARLKITPAGIVVEATPEGKSLKHNGKRVAQCQAAPGDELGLGGYRAYLFDTDTAPAKPAPPPAAKPAVASKPAAPVKKAAEAPMELGWDDLAEPAPAKPAVPEVKQSWLSKLRSRPGTETPMAATVAADGGRGLTTFADEDESARKLAKAPLIVLLAVMLVGLSATAFGLWWIIDRTRANRAYESGVAMYESGDFRTAAERLQNFLKMRPSEERSSNAHVLEVLSRLQDLASGQSPQLTGALTLAEKELPPLADEPAWKDRQMNAAEVVATLTRDLAAKAKQNASIETVEQARSAYRLHSQLAGDAAAQQRTRLKVDQIIAEAEAAVAKGEAKTQALAAIDAALKNRESLKAFQARDTLLARYPDLLADPLISKRLDQANQQVQENVKVLKISREASRDDASQTLGPPQSLFVRSGQKASAEKPTAPPAPGQVSVVSGGGLIVAVEQATGHVLWQRPSGTSAGFEPLLIPDESPPSVLAYDDRDQSLVRLNLLDGKLVWRQPVADTPRQAPLVMGNRLILALPTRGELLWLDLATGRVNDGLQLQWPLAGSVVASANNQTLYVPADQSVLFVIQVEPKACLKSVYMGHGLATQRTGAVRSGRFLIFPENRGLNLGSLQTWLLDERGVSPQRLQQEALEGWSWFKPGQQGNLLWASHDRGGFAVFSIGDYTLAKPLSQVGKSAAIDAPAHPTVALAVGQREALIVDRTVKQYRLDAQSGRLDVLRSWDLPESLPASAIRKLDDYTFVISLSVNRDLGRSVMAIDLRQDEPLWQTTWGSPVELAGKGQSGGKVRWLNAAGTGVDVPISRENLATAVEWSPEKPKNSGGGDSTEGADPSATTWVWHNSGTTRLGLSAARPNQLRIQESADKEPRTITLPLATSLPPVLLGKNLVVAGRGGEVAIASSDDGSPLGQPFVPDYEKTALWDWSGMVPLEDQAVVLADNTGRIVRLVLEQNPPRLRQTARVVLEGKFSGTLLSTGRAILALMADGAVLSLAGRDLSTQTKWTFPGGGTRLLSLNEKQGMIFHPSGLIRLVDGSGQSEKEATLPSAMPMAEPLVHKNQIVWLSQTSQSELVVWPMADPAPRKFPLKTWVLGPLIIDGDDWVVVERPGVLRRIPPEILSQPPSSSNKGGQP